MDDGMICDISEDLRQFLDPEGISETHTAAMLVALLKKGLVRAGVNQDGRLVWRFLGGNKDAPN